MTGCPWDFPDDVEGQPLIEIKRLALIKGLEIRSGMNLPMIGKLLGHTQVQTTQRYAHLFDDPLRAGLDQVGDILRANSEPFTTVPSQNGGPDQAERPGARGT